MTYMATPQDKNPCPVGHEIYNFVDSSLVIITIYYFVWSMPFW